MLSNSRSSISSGGSSSSSSSSSSSGNSLSSSSIVVTVSVVVTVNADRLRIRKSIVIAMDIKKLKRQHYIGYKLSQHFL